MESAPVPSTLQMSMSVGSAGISNPRSMRDTVLEVMPDLSHATLFTDALDSLPASFEVHAHHRPVGISDGIIAELGAASPRRYRFS